MRRFSLLFIVPALASCATAVADPVRTAQAEANLQNLISGKVAGQPASCLPTYRSGEMVVIDDNTVVFRAGASRVYVNEMRGGGCAPLGTGHYTLVTRTTGSGLCSGDIAQVADMTTGHVVGSCTIGDFVPYTRAGS